MEWFDGWTINRRSSAILARLAALPLGICVRARTSGDRLETGSGRGTRELSDVVFIFRGCAIFREYISDLSLNFSRIQLYGLQLGIALF